MCGMTTDSPVLRLDPRRPLLWRDPSTLQVGADPVLAVLADVDDARLRLVESLVVGVTRERLLQLAQHLAAHAQAVLDVGRGGPALAVDARLPSGQHQAGLGPAPVPAGQALNLQPGSIGPIAQGLQLAAQAGKGGRARARHPGLLAKALNDL